MKRILLLLIFGIGIVYLGWGQTTYTWTGTTSISWLTTTNWSPATVPGNKTTTTNNDIAYFNNTTFVGTTINMNTQGGAQYLGALNFGTSATNARSVANSSAVGGTMYFNGVTLNGVNNTIFWNQSSATHSFTNGAGTLNLGLNATDHVIQITGTGGVTIASAITGSNANLTKAGSGSGVLTLSGANTYSGNTTISAGTLALSISGSISSSPNIIIGSSGKFDVTGLTTALALGSGQTLKASATGSNTTGTVTVSSTKGLTLSAGGVTFTAYGGGSTAPLTINGASAGALALNSAPVTVTTTTALTVGTYTLIAKAGSATGVSGTPGALTVDGSGLASATSASLSVVSGQLILTVISTSSPTKLVITNINPSTPTVGSTFSVTVQARDGSDNPANVTSATDISLTKATGAGTLGGTTTGQIANGSNSVVISGVTYSVGEVGVSITAETTGGMSLTSGTSGTFTVLASQPTTASSAMVFGAQTTTEIPLTSWTVGNGANRIVVRRAGGSATAPTNGTNYAVSSTLGTGTVIYNGNSNTVTASSLTAGTQYSFDIYEYNGSGATANYGSVFTSSRYTLQTEPSTHSATPTASSVAPTTLTLNFTTTGTGGLGYIILRKEGSSPSTGTPVDGTNYTVGNALGDGVIAAFIAANSTATANITGLTAATQYTFSIIPFGRVLTNTETYNYYLGGSIPTLTVSTLATAPTTLSTVMIFGAQTTTQIPLTSWTAGNGANRIVVARLFATSRVSPTGGTGYTVNSNSFTDGSNAITGTGNVVIYNGSSNTVTVTGLTAGTQYSFDIYEYNGSGATANYGTVYTSSRYTLQTEPSTHSATFSASSIAPTTLTLTFTTTGTSGLGYIILRKEGASASTGTPVDGIGYTVGNALGDGIIAGFVTANSTATASITGLTANTQYTFSIIPFGRVSTNVETYNYYLGLTIPTLTVSTLASVPSVATNLTFASVTYNSFTASFVAPGTTPSGYLVLRRTGDAVTGAPVAGNEYTQGNTNIGGGTNDVVYVGSSVWTDYAQSVLTDNTTYYYAIYSYNGSGVTTNYSATLTGSQTTASVSAPIAQAATSTSSTGFTANWDASAGAGSYRLDVSEIISFGGSTANFVGWTFPTSGTTVTPDITNANNTSKTLTTNGGTISSAAGATTQAPSASEWQSGSGSKYWQIDFDATGYINLTVSSKQRSSNTGPRDFKLQYKNGISGSWTDVESGTITCAADFTTGVLNTVSLPSSCDNQSSLSLRWIMTSNTSVNNSAVAIGGTCRIDDILIYGSVPSYVTGYGNLTVNSNSQAVTGLTPNTTYYYRVRAVGSYSTSPNSVTITQKTNAAASSAFNGSVNSSWENASNWDSGIPGAITNVTIPADKLAVVADYGECNNLTIASKGSLMVNNSSTGLSVNGNLLIQSDASGTGSFIYDAGDLVLTGTATVQRFIPSDATWHFLSCPMTGTLPIICDGNFAPLTTNFNSGTGATYGFFKWLEATSISGSVWNNLKNSDWSVNTTDFGNPPAFTTGTGYLVEYASDFAGSTTKSFAGTLANGSQNIPVTVTNNKFNLVGNPFCSAIDWKAGSGWNMSVLKTDGTNGGKNIWIWNGASGNYGTYSTTTSEDVGTNSVGRYIAPTQAFFVQANTAGNIVLDNNVRVANIAGQLKSGEELSNSIRLAVNSNLNTYSDEILIEFGHTSNDGGSGKWWSLYPEAPSLYTVKNDKNYSISFLTDITENLTVPVSFKAGVNGNYTLTPTFDQSSFGSINLQDLKTGVIQDLKTNPVYTFTASTGDDAARFILKFGSVGINDPQTTETGIYSYNNQICIHNPGNATLEVYNMAGQRILVQEINSNGLYQTTLNNGIGYYVVRLTNAGQVKVSKVFIK